MFVQLDKEDGPVIITASWEQESYVTGESCRHSITETVSGYQRYRVPARCGYDDADPKPHPRLIVIACGDGNRGLHHLRWRGWNTRQATATGDVYANDCKPYCARGRFHDYPTKVRLWRPRGGKGQPYVYTRMSYRLGGRTWRYRLKTDKYGSYWV